MKTKLRLPIQIKLWKNDKLISNTYRRVKDRILLLVQKENWDKAYIKVIYDIKRGYDNSGYYFSLVDLKEVLCAFTEKAEIKHILGDKK